MSSSESREVPQAKKPKTSKREAHFNKQWIIDFNGVIKESSKGSTFAYCVLCSSNFSIAYGGKNDVTVHINGKVQDKAKAVSESRSVGSYFKPQTLQSTIEAETRWSLLIAKQNIPF